MWGRKFWVSAILIGLAPFAYVVTGHLTTVDADGADVPPMIPSTITFSELVSAHGQPSQRAVRVVANKRDRSVSETCFYTHTDASSGNNAATYDRQLWLNRTEGFFRVEIYKRETGLSKITFPYVPEMVALRNRTWMNPQENCLKTYAGKSSIGKDKYMGRPQLFLPGMGLVETVMTSVESPDMKLTAWYAPALGCVEVQHIATFPQADGSVAVNAMYPVLISQKDPDESLFSDEGAPETNPLEVARRNTMAAALTADHSENQIAEMQTKSVDGAVMKNKQAQYKRAWALFRANKLRP